MDVVGAIKTECLDGAGDSPIIRALSPQMFVIFPVKNIMVDIRGQLIFQWWF